MEFRWRAALGATTSKLLTTTGARILVEFIQSEKSLEDALNDGRPEDKRIEPPRDVSSQSPPASRNSPSRIFVPSDA